MTSTSFAHVLARELVDQDTPRFRRGEERHAARLTAERIVEHWPALVPMPETPLQAERVARSISVRIETETFQPEDIVAIMTPVRL